MLRILNSMKATVQNTLLATVIATVVGTMAWLLGLAHRMWPAHPQIAVLLLTLVATVAVQQLFPPSR